jgi:hypothetical protein
MVEMRGIEPLASTRIVALSQLSYIPMRPLNNFFITSTF